MRVGFFKQKTAYEMRISDWSSDVCSSDLILGAFSEEAFALAAYSDRAKVAIEEIQFGLNNNDLAIMIGGGSKNPFDRGGLVIARASKIPAEQAQVTLEADLEAKRLSDAAEATGIKEKIEPLPIQPGPFSRKRYFDLHPQWPTTCLLAIGR